LIKQGYEKYIKNKLSNFKQLDIEEILLLEDFPGYIFIRSIKISECLQKEILLFEGTLKFLGKRNNEIKEFSGSEISCFFKKEKAKEVPKFKIGDYVVIKNGDLSDIDGVIIEIKSSFVKIKPEFFHKTIKVKLQDIQHI